MNWIFTNRYQPVNRVFGARRTLVPSQARYQPNLHGISASISRAMVPQTSLNRLRPWCIS